MIGQLIERAVRYDSGIFRIALVVLDLDREQWNHVEVSGSLSETATKRVEGSAARFTNDVHAELLAMVN
jgi:hypothetical protein